MNKTRYFIIQVIFFGLSTLVLHLLLFDFLGFYRERDYSANYTLKDDVWHWLPVIILDLCVGISLGMLHSLVSVMIIKNEKYLKTLIIVTDSVWLLFCAWWYFNNRGVINVEAIGHVLSPFMVGFTGGMSALINLMIVLILNKNSTKKS